MPPNAESHRASNPEIALAHRDVELAKVELEESLAGVSDSGRKAVVGMVRKARPVLVVAAVVIGIVVVFRLLRRSSRARAEPGFAIVRSAERTPLVKIALAAALRGALRVLAARLAEQAAARLVETVEQGELHAQDVDDSASLDAVSTVSSK